LLCPAHTLKQDSRWELSHQRERSVFAAMHGVGQRGEGKAQAGCWTIGGLTFFVQNRVTSEREDKELRKHFILTSPAIYSSI